MASAGAMVKSTGSVAASAKATTLARGLTLCLWAADSVISTQAAAPSFRVLALAAVIVPDDTDGIGVNQTDRRYRNRCGVR